MRRNVIILVGVVVAAVMIVLVWRVMDAERAKKRAELEAGLASARIITERFERVSNIEVARLTGDATARTCYDGTVFDPCQYTKVPYVTEYKINLSNVSPNDYRWDAETKTMSIDLPDIVPDKPIIDMAEAEIRQDGVYISREAGRELQKQAVIRLQSVTREASRKPEHLRAATENARRIVENLVRTPLKMAGLSDVRVVVRFPGEAVPPGMPSERWDVSKPIAEVLAELR